MFVLFCAWIAISLQAADTEEPGTTDHWAYQAIQKFEVPPGRNPVDFFVHKALNEAGASQNPPADRHTFLRRATLDLTGLPPTRDEIAAFVSDKSDDAWEDLIDRLLDSPHYGERWGRHWLDVARYVQGTIKIPGVEKIDLAEPYRDYVVRSFNSDKPYNQFIAEQLAGDLLAPKKESKQDYLDRITAPAFLSIGQWFDECTDPNKLRLDIIDEQISTTTRAFLALDFACSRCHDHKFDPIPTKDYYALAGIFRSTEITAYFSDKWKDGRPRAVRDLAMPDQVEAKRKLTLQLSELKKRRIETLRAARDKMAVKWAGPKEEIEGEITRIEAENFSGHKNLKIVETGPVTALASRRLLDQWAKYRLEIPAAGDYALLVRYAADEAAPVDLEINGETLPKRVLAEPTYGETPDHFRFGLVSLPALKKGGNFIRFKVDRHEPFPVLDRLHLFPASKIPSEKLLPHIFAPPTPASLDPGFLSDDQKNALQQIDNRIAEIHGQIPDLPPTLAVSDSSSPLDLPVHIGGDVYRQEGKPVARGAPGLANHLIPDSFSASSNSSGRKEFASWLTHPDNPLTARVMVNRIWHWHFGKGLVRTPDDFGEQGGRPTHPELLDWLAVEFIESGWSIKHIHRLILNSSTYRATSATTAENLKLDADGALLSRFPKRRLEVEAIYDSMLTSIGKVPRQESGSALDTSRSKDRALYILTSSRSPLGLGLEIRKMFPLFGFDPSGRPMHDRDESITPEQSLWWLNNTLPEYYAGKLAEKILEEYDSARERTLAAHEIVLGRPPGKKAESAFLRYLDQLDDDEVPEKEAWTRACLALFSTRSFQTLD